MKITILTDNIAGAGFQSEHGLSYLIEIDDEKFLFDTGHSDIFLKNAEKLAIDIEHDVRTVILSHGHWDHGNGLPHLTGKNLVTHPGSFAKRYRKEDHTYLGLVQGREELEKSYRLMTTHDAVQLSPNLWFLGEIPRKNNYENQDTPYVLEGGKQDFIADDSALAAVSDGKLVIISGCAHSGICNICEQARKITGISEIKAVMGGFHLKDQGLQTRRTLEYFMNNKVENILPAHCTEAPAKSFFRQHFQFPEVKTGMVFEF
jgi:7,8-dihydropterin-6-yl-methyl-4-(beta-D-ribofuranosyl)aminobenzene 5'-phosphate synthase